MDPLAQLQDIQLPQNIHHWPVAVGWWLLLALIVMLIIWMSITIKKYIKIRKNKKQALARLQDKKNSIADSIAILKWVALQYFPREQVASLAGVKFKDFLTQQLPENKQPVFEKLTNNHWLSAYQAANTDEINETFTQGAILWVQQALPPKKIKTLTTSSNLISSQPVDLPNNLPTNNKEQSL